MNMKEFDFIAWLFVVVFIAWFAYHRATAHNTDHYQHYDSLGNGIGCEGPDLADM